jgi:hypothetical protein
MALNMVVGALEFVMAELHFQITFPPPISFVVGSSFLVTYFHSGYLFSLDCFLAAVGLFALMGAPLAMDERVTVTNELGGGGATPKLTFPPFL